MTASPPFPRPKGLPDWVWDEFLTHLGTKSPFDSGLLYEPTDADLKLFERILSAPDTAVTWSALKRRRPPVRSELGLSAIGRLMEEASTAFRGPDPHDAKSRTERKTVGARIAALANELRDELSALRVQAEGNYPAEMTDRVLMRSIALGRYSRIRASFPYTQAKNPKSAQYWYIRGRLDLLDTAEALLPALATGAMEWAAGTPVVLRPSGENHERLYFIRRIAGYFTRQYGTPLHEANAALARAAYQAEISPATVAKLVRGS